MVPMFRGLAQGLIATWFRPLGKRRRTLYRSSLFKCKCNQQWHPLSEITCRTCVSGACSCSAWPSLLAQSIGRQTYVKVVLQVLSEKTRVGYLLNL